MEQTSIKRIGTLHPKLRDSALRAYTKAVKLTPKGVHPFITETSRSFERSDALYNQPFDGKDNDGDGKIDEADEKVTTVSGGGSNHNFHLALDFVLEINGKMSWVVDKNWMIVVKCFKEEGFVWGGDWKSFKDYPHLEKTFGYKTSQLLAKYKAGDTFIENGVTYVNI